LLATDAALLLGGRLREEAGQALLRLLRFLDGAVDKLLARRHVVDEAHALPHAHEAVRFENESRVEVYLVTAADEEYLLGFLQGKR
jgi:hypothetical protein